MTHTEYARPFSVEKMSVHVGADVAIADLRALLRDPVAILCLKAALAEHLVLRVRGIDLSADELCRMAELWGPLMDVRHAGNGAAHVPGNDFIKVISNARNSAGQRVGDGNSAAQMWHSDTSYWEAPPGVTLFCGKVAPPSLPKTHFMNMIAVYEALPERLKTAIRDLRVHHHQYPRGVEVNPELKRESLPLERRTACVTHPLVRRHLASNRPLLFLPYRRDSIVVGMPEAESRELFDELWRHADAERFGHGAALEPGDLVIWDNTAVLHRRDGWPAAEARAMWHISAQGEVPTPMFTRREINENALGIDGRGDKAYIAALEAVIP